MGKVGRHAIDLFIAIGQFFVYRNSISVEWINRDQFIASVAIQIGKDRFADFSFEDFLVSPRRIVRIRQCYLENPLLAGNQYYWFAVVGAVEKTMIFGDPIDERFKLAGTVIIQLTQLDTPRTTPVFLEVLIITQR